GALLTSSNALEIGGDSIFGQFFAGVIDEVRIYNVALSATQIQSDMQAAIGDSDTSGAGGTKTPGLVAAYSFNDGSGTTVSDASGNGHNGTVANGTWSTSGKYGKALVFNGHSTMVTIPDSPALHLSNGMTIEAWVQPTAVNGTWRDVIYKGNDAYA